MNQPRAESVTAVKVDGAWTTSIDYHISLEPVGRRVRGHLNGVPVVDSLNALVMLEKGHLPVYYFPRADVAAECLSSTDHHTYCPHKGEASYWTVSAGSKAIENGAWAYLDPYAHLASLADLVAFYWNAMDGGGKRTSRCSSMPATRARTSWSWTASGRSRCSSTRPWSRARAVRESCTRPTSPPATTSRPKTYAPICWWRAEPEPAAPTRARPSTGTPACRSARSMTWYGAIRVRSRSARASRRSCASSTKWSTTFSVDGVAEPKTHTKWSRD